MTDARELARLAIANRLPEISAPDALPALKDAIAVIEGRERVADALRAHSDNPALKMEHAGIVKLSAALKATGAKLQPGMSQAQSSAWVDGIRLSLARYPMSAAIYAAQMAQGEPFQYGLGSVDARLHELAKEAADRDAAALARLRMMIRQIERAQTQKALPPPEDRPMTVEEIAATPDAYVELGRKLGYISDEDYEAAMALREAQCSGS